MHGNLKHKKNNPVWYKDAVNEKLESKRVAVGGGDGGGRWLGRGVVLRSEGVVVQTQSAGLRWPGGPSVRPMLRDVNQR